MIKDIILYFLILLLPVCLVPIATHRILEQELTRGREVGLAYLQARADALAQEMRRTHTQTIPATAPTLQAALLDDAGHVLQGTWPKDDRCAGEASLEPERPGIRIGVTWAGAIPPGLVHRTRLFRTEVAVYLLSFGIFLMGFVLVLRALARSHRLARERLEFVRTFSHRLKTPLTSIALCAQLAQAKRLDDTQREESHATIVREAQKMSAIVDDALDRLQEIGHG